MDDPIRYDTSQVESRDRFAYWSEAVCNSYVQLGCEVEENRESFRGFIEISRHTSLSISRVGGKKHRVRRRKEDIRKASDSYFLLSLQTARQSRISQLGASAVLEPGDMAIFSSSDPYELSLTDDFSQTVVQLPREKLLSRLPDAEQLTARKIDGQQGIGKLVRENILAFSAYADDAQPLVQSLVQDTLIDLIATGLATLNTGKLQLSSPERYMMQRIKSIVRDQYTDAQLDRQRVAEQLGMSVRRINAILAKDETSLSKLIRHTRLQAAADELRDPRHAGLTVSQIALRNGFENFQHFSKTFRRQFSAAPRDYRATA